MHHNEVCDRRANSHIKTYLQSWVQHTYSAEIWKSDGRQNIDTGTERDRSFISPQRHNLQTTINCKTDLFPFALETTLPHLSSNNTETEIVFLMREVRNYFYLEDTTNTICQLLLKLSAANATNGNPNNYTLPSGSVCHTTVVLVLPSMTDKLKRHMKLRLLKPQRTSRTCFLQEHCKYVVNYFFSPPSTTRTTSRVTF